MFSRILVPLDGSRLAAQILPVARRVLAPAGELTLLRVLEPGAEAAAERAHGSAAEVAAHQQLEDLREELARHDVRATPSLRHGDPAEAIVRAGNAPPHDLIAMSTHGRTGLQRLTRGSVAEAVLRRADVPLLLANPRALERAGAAPKLGRILVALDGSPRSGEVLELVEAVAVASQAAVTLLRVEPMVFTEMPAPALAPPWDPHRVERSLAGARDALVAAGLKVDVHAEFGFEAAAIARATEQADLVVLGTSGRRGILRLVLGSVAEDVLRHAACPTLIKRLGLED